MNCANLPYMNTWNLKRGNGVDFMFGFGKSLACNGLLLETVDVKLTNKQSLQ